jgi:hypothetical protein
VSTLRLEVSVVPGILALVVMENKGLLFMPDISGFTRFVNEMEIGHGQWIIQQLLETLMDANQLDLVVSEVEGDAILFYRFGDRPDMEQLYAQIERMFCDFHRRLMAFDKERTCDCGACVAAARLTLKVVTHYGEFMGYTVKNFNKLIGKDVIVVHQLLKNDIPEHEYWLVTSELLEGRVPAPHAPWMEWNTSAKSTESGEIPFHFVRLGQLKSELAIRRQD